jgi:hypothetical protein
MQDPGSRKIVEQPDMGLGLRKQSLDQVTTDESGPARYQRGTRDAQGYASFPTNAEFML